MKFGTPRQILLLKIFLPIALALYGYGLWANRDITWRWKEQTVLSDGTELLIERVEVRETKGGGELFQGPLRGTKTTQVIIPAQPKPVIWESSLAPMIVARGTPPVEWVVIASPVWCEEYWQYGSPRPPYVQFEYRQGTWRHQQVTPQWYGKKSNLLMSVEQQFKSNGKLVTANDVNQFNNRVYKVFERYLQVDGKKVSKCDQ